MKTASKNSFNIIFLLLSMTTILSCNSAGNSIGFNKGTFGYDREFIFKHDTGALLLGNGESRLIVSPKYQAKVFTSTAAGDKGHSFGWIHYSAFDGPADQHMNAYGGENRLWLGPEGGAFSLFFNKGATMGFENWKTPAAFDTESWNVTGHAATWVALEKEMSLLNYAGTPLLLKVDRHISILTHLTVDSMLGTQPDSTVKVVAYSTENKMTNTGKSAWDEQSGMPCMWLLDMFPTSDQTTMVVPYLADEHNSKPATTDYFGEIPASRLKTDGKALFFKADGKMRGKLGIHPSRAKNMAGSYDARNQVLTIIMFDIDNSSRYLNQEWKTNKPPFSGDAVNAYNDGPLADGKQMGPFYELESVSPAAFLKPGETQVHHHSVFHFTGPERALNKISVETLGVSLNEIKNAFF